MNKYLKFAEILDAHRVFSRLIFLLISVFVVWYTIYVTQWYFDNFEKLAESGDSSMYGASGLLGITIPAIFKFAIEYAKHYLDGGVDWKEKYETHSNIKNNRKETNACNCHE